MEDLQSSALPLGYAATAFNSRGKTLSVPVAGVKKLVPGGARRDDGAGDGI
jgi:hypothetical protein